MVTMKQGNLLDSDAQTLVNTVNCVGVMGKGIALEFKKRFPAMFNDYAERCKRGAVQLGHPYMFLPMHGPRIVNFPTKDHWRSLARLEDIVRGLNDLEDHYKEWGITSIAVPPLGCGNGQLEWSVIGPTLYRHLLRFDIPVELYAPAGTPLQEMQASFLADVPSPTRDSTGHSWINPGWMAVLEIVKRLDDQPFHWPIGRTVFQKIFYVSTKLGIPTGLQFDRGSYGPYSAGVKRLESRLMNNGLLQEKRVGQRYEISVGETFEDARLTYFDEISRWHDEIDRTVDLFMRIGTSAQAEIVATVLYSADSVSRACHKPTERDVFDEVQSWKSRRHPPLDPLDIRETIRVLAAQDWIDVAPSNDPLVDEWDLTTALPV